nr:MFS transporter [Actinomycetales bacterium]
MVRAAALATAAVFSGNGLIFAIWASRLPSVRDLLNVSPAQMGGILLIASLGSILALPTTGGFIMRFGLRPTLGTGAVIATVAMALAALGAQWGSIPLVAFGLFLAWMGSSVVDVGMNLHGGRVEHLLGRAIMPLLHAGFSAGAIIGAVIGWATSLLGIGIVPTVGGVAALVALTMLSALRYFRLPEQRGSGSGQSIRASLTAWREPRTLLIGLVVLGAGLTEGAANDWLALAVVDGFGQDHATGALTFGIFLGFMTATRLVGPRLLERFGRVAVLRVLVLLAILGLALFVFAPLGPAMVGVVLWGVGAGLGFPVGMSAASDDPLKAAARVSVVSTVGYAAFMAGPPVLGLLAEHVGYRSALGFVLIPLLVSFLASAATRPLEERSWRSGLRPH